PSRSSRRGRTIGYARCPEARRTRGGLLCDVPSIDPTGELCNIAMRKAPSGRLGRRVDWDKLKTFHFAAETGSLTAAAEKLGVSQSSVSRQIAALENEMGVPLFQRHARG